MRDPKCQIVINTKYEPFWETSENLDCEPDFTMIPVE